MRKTLLFISLATILSGCTSTGLNSSLGTKKNPKAIFSEPSSGKTINERTNPFILANYEVLLKAAKSAPADSGEIPTNKMKDYLSAGFALSDFYCSSFFQDADESQRRRRFGRAATNDVGTAMTTILGLANAGENLVTGVAAGFGLGDNLWRNYDDAFTVTPELSNIQSLVFAAQDNWRERSLGKKASLPANYYSAQTVIMRYANLCSTLGMQALLNKSSTQEKRALDGNTEELKNSPENISGNNDKKNAENRSGFRWDESMPITASPAISSSRYDQETLAGSALPPDQQNDQ